jgi:hypothetical protein
MRLHPRLLAFVPLLLLASPTVASSGVPSPANSTVDACLLACPAADFTFHVTVRDLASNPLPGSSVVVDFSQCPQVVACPYIGDGLTWDATSRTVRATSDASGLATFTMHLGGVCPNTQARIYADAVLLAQRTLANPDQDGNTIVDANDDAVEAGKIGGADLTGDLTCEGTVTAADLAVVQAHHHHICLFIDPVRRPSWGALKITYR